MADATPGDQLAPPPGLKLKVAPGLRNVLASEIKQGPRSSNTSLEHDPSTPVGARSVSTPFSDHRPTAFSEQQPA